MFHDAAFALFIFGTLRLVGIAWPTKWLPWPFYAGVVAVAWVLLVIFPSK